MTIYETKIIHREIKQARFKMPNYNHSEIGRRDWRIRFCKVLVFSGRRLWLLSACRVVKYKLNRTNTNRIDPVYTFERSTKRRLYQGKQTSPKEGKKRGTRMTGTGEME